MDTCGVVSEGELLQGNVGVEIEHCVGGGGSEVVVGGHVAGPVAGGGGGLVV